MRNSYLVARAAGTRCVASPLVRGFEDAGRIVNAVNQVEVTPLEEEQTAALRIVPSYPDLPMESVFTRPGATQKPGVYQRMEGKGRVVYFPGDIDRTFWQVLDVDHGKLLRNAVDVGDERGTAGDGRWQRRGGCGGVGAGTFDDGAPGEPDESDDDEGAGAGDSADHAATCDGQNSGGAAGGEGAFAGGGDGRCASHVAGDRAVIDVPGIELHEVVAMDLRPA